LTVFVDTSAVLAVLHADDEHHSRAAATFRSLLERETSLLTSNYCVLETVAIVQHRFGSKAVRRFHADLLPVFSVEWVDAAIHQEAMTALLTADRRRLSLVDCSSFSIMRRLGVTTAFHFDRHFREQGFVYP